MELRGCPKPIGYVTIDGIKKPVACMKWTCPYCGPIKKHRLACRISKGFFGHDDVIAITLTQKLHSKRNILKDFETVRYRLKTRHGISMDRYFWVKEFTKKGQRHIHILCSVYVDHKLLKKLWKEVTLGESYRVWINEKPIRNSAGYLFKYLGKAYKVEIRYHRKERRYGFSRHSDFKPTRELPLLGNFWDIIAKPIDTYNFRYLSEQEGILLIDELYPEESKSVSIAVECALS
jgi:hypothetical protein